MKGIYPATFEKIEGRYYSKVPDLPGCVTSGDTLEEAYEMTLDAANLWMETIVEDKQPTPKASKIGDIVRPEGAEVMLIQIDTDLYLQQIDTTPVRRTVSIPSWMDQVAQRQGVSLSKTLQDALRARFA